MDLHSTAGSQSMALLGNAYGRHQVERDILREQVATLQASGTLEELKAEVNQLRQQNTALQQQASQEVKGNISIRFVECVFLNLSLKGLHARCLRWQNVSKACC
eukprot:TRINITY_DN8880_c0_g1_i2.p4 TRINITY_DN8880_c0_g1~~TRINITY_DN8880_c0_g1_i2.p4  ORF type:complete len:104 (+),score=13.22 TRINITY_DN8880_c0_g1_i2:894-1205(+)